MRSDADGRDGARPAGGSDIRSLCSGTSEGGGDEMTGLGVDDFEFKDAGGEWSRNNDEEAGDDCREL